MANSVAAERHPLYSLLLAEFKPIVPELTKDNADVFLIVPLMTYDV